MQFGILFSDLNINEINVATCSTLTVVTENKRTNAARECVCVCVSWSLACFWWFGLVWFLFTIHSCANFKVFSTLCHYFTVQCSHLIFMLSYASLRHSYTCTRQTFTHKYTFQNLLQFSLKARALKHSHKHRTIVLFIQRR